MRFNIIDIIYNSQLNEFVIRKFKALYGESKALQEGYKFDPGELSELVTKRKSYQDFKKAINLMNMSLQILKNKDPTAVDPKKMIEIKLPSKLMINSSSRRRRKSVMVKLPEAIISLRKKPESKGRSRKGSIMSNSSHKGAPLSQKKKSLKRLSILNKNDKTNTPNVHSDNNKQIQYRRPISTDSKFKLAPPPRNIKSSFTPRTSRSLKKSNFKEIPEAIILEEPVSTPYENIISITPTQNANTEASSPDKPVFQSGFLEKGTKL